MYAVYFCLVQLYRSFFTSQLKTILTMGCFDAINAKAFCNVHSSRLGDLILTLSSV